MNITPHKVGATVDVTDEALQLLDYVALAYAADPDRMSQLPLGLATAREERDGLVEVPGVDRSVDVIEGAEMDLTGARDALIGELPNEPITFNVAETDCRRIAAELLTAADQSVTAIVRATQMLRSLSLPRQQDRRAA